MLKRITRNISTDMDLSIENHIEIVACVKF